MSLEQDVGRLVGLVEGQAKDIEFIKDHMVGRQEFELRVAEHSEFRKDIDELRSQYDRGHLTRDLGQKILFIVVAAVVGAVLATIGL